MGCKNGGARNDDSATIAQPALVEHQRYELDPDLGWRSYRNLSVDVGPTVAQKGDSLYPYSRKWDMFFYNERDNKARQENIPTLALNIAIRSAMLADAFRMTLQSNIEDSSEKYVYKHLRVPDYGWKLEERCFLPKRAPNKKSTSARGLENERPCQLMRNVAGEVFMVDVPAVGMNIAEQLYKLEKKTATRHEYPDDLFGWTIAGAVRNDQIAISMEDQAFWVVPEELIMDVTNWVQELYFTQAVLR